MTHPYPSFAFATTLRLCQQGDSKQKGRKGADQASGSGGGGGGDGHEGHDDEGRDDGPVRPFFEHLLETFWYFLISVGQLLLLLGIGGLAALVLNWAHKAIPTLFLSKEKADLWAASHDSLAKSYKDVFQWVATAFFVAAAVIVIYEIGKYVRDRVKNVTHQVPVEDASGSPLQQFWKCCLSSSSCLGGLCLFSVIINIIAMFVTVVIPGAPPDAVWIITGLVKALEVILIAAGIFLTVLNYVRLIKKRWRLVKK
jgi:hypothetical protein